MVVNPEVEGNIVVDHFQGTEFRNLLESGQAALLDTKLEAEHMEIDFRGALERLQDKRRKQRFDDRPLVVREFVASHRSCPPNLAIRSEVRAAYPLRLFSNGA